MQKIFKRFAACILLGLAVVCVLSAQTDRGDNLVIKVAVMGPGDELYFWWGHIALVVEDAGTGRGRFYDYGLFSFKNDHFFVNFALGRLWYSCGVSQAANSINGYIETNRDVTLYILNLSPEKKEEVFRKAEWDILPENRNYLYHHFRHNCATPIINIIDVVTDGQFRAQFGEAPGRFTLREHVRRHTWFSPFSDWLLSFLMGQGIDTPTVIWDEMFLPSEVGRRISEFSYINADGVLQPLVSEKEVVFQAQDRPAVLDVPRRQWPVELTFSLFVALILACLLYLQSKSPAAGQVLLGIAHTLLGAFFGMAGLVLFFMSTFTQHDYTFHNANLFFCNPLLLAAIPLGLRYAASRNYDRRLRFEFMLRALWLLVALGIFASMLVKLLPVFWQQNLTEQMLMLPIALVLSLEPAGLKRMVQRVFWRFL